MRANFGTHRIVFICRLAKFITDKNKMYQGYRVARSVFVLAAMMLMLAAAPALSQDATPWSINNSPLPPSTGFINDYAGVIDAATKQQLETKLKALKESTNPPVEIAVAVVKTTGGRDIFDYSLAVARGWKIGSKDDDNPGALLLVAIDDRKYFTQVSKDLEDELPDGLVGSLQRQYLVPEFKKGNYAKGISDTVDAYIDAVKNKGAAKAPQKPVAGNNDSLDGTGLFCCAAIILVIILIIISRSKGGPTKGDRNRWGGGFGGGGSALPWIIGGILGSGGSGGSSSSGSWGGGSSGGGGGWGGFGGGGDFGGGGSGGSW
jgi:uncharacterized protein